MPALSDDFDPFEDDPGELEPLQLETVEEPVDKRPPASGPQPLTVPGSGVPRSISSVRRIEPPRLEVDPFEVLALADYGPVPTKIWETPAYAVRVVSRRRELQSEARRAREEHALRENAFFDSLVALVDSLRPALERHPDGGRWLAPIYDIESRARARGEALESTSQEFSAKVGEIDREIALIEEAQIVERKKLEPLTEEFSRRKDEHERSEAMLKRIDIEIRAAQQAARAAAGPDAKVAPPEHASRLAALAMEREARSEDVVRTKGELDEVRRPYQAQERVIAENLKEIEGLRKRRRSLEESYARQLSVRSEGVADAARERREMSIEMGQRLLEESPVPLDASAKSAVEKASVVAAEARRKLERYVQASEAFEREPLRRGLILLGTGLALIVAFSLWFVLGRDAG